MGSIASVCEVDVKKVTPDRELVSLCVQATGVPKREVEDMLSYNVMTVAQLARLTGNSIHTIVAHTRPRINKEGTKTTLDKTYPFPTSPDNDGPGFIFVNERCRKYMRKVLEAKVTTKIGGKVINMPKSV